MLVCLPDDVTEEKEDVYATTKSEEEELTASDEVRF